MYGVAILVTIFIKKFLILLNLILVILIHFGIASFCTTGLEVIYFLRN